MDIRTRSDEKVFVKERFVFGFTSSFRMGQLLRYNLSIPQKPEGMQDTEYITTVFIDAVRACLKSGGYAEIDKGVEKGGFFIVGYNGNIYHIGSDFQVGIPITEYDADGCGEDYAMGAFYVLPKKMKPIEKIKKALEAAAHFSSGVRGPFNILSA